MEWSVTGGHWVQLCKKCLLVTLLFSDDPMTSCRKIVHWRNHLKFPKDTKLSPEAKDLICSLLCDVDHRLGTWGVALIKVHPWFTDIEWDKLYEMEAAFKPEVNGELDTRNFMKFDELDTPTPARYGSGPLRKMHLSPRDLSSVGYIVKNFDAVKELRNLSGDFKESQVRKETTEESDICVLTSMDDVMMSP